MDREITYPSITAQHKTPYVKNVDASKECKKPRHRNPRKDDDNGKLLFPQGYRM